MRGGGKCMHKHLSIWRIYYKWNLGEQCVQTTNIINWQLRKILYFVHTHLPNISKALTFTMYLCTVYDLHNCLNSGAEKAHVSGEDICYGIDWQLATFFIHERVKWTSPSVICDLLRHVPPKMFVKGFPNVWFQDGRLSIFVTDGSLRALNLLPDTT